MSKIIWDDLGERTYDAGADHGVLYLPDGRVIPWNGLTGVSESWGEASSTPVYFDGVKFMDMETVSDFEAEITAITYPDELPEIEGVLAVDAAIHMDDQSGSRFGFSYRSFVGNDLEGTDFGYQIHVIYNAMIAPTDRARTTHNESPEATEFAWDIWAVPEEVRDMRPTAHIILDSRFLSPALMEQIEGYLYGTEETDAYLPSLYTLQEELTPAPRRAFAYTADAPLVIPTYDGSGQAVHPDVEIIEEGFGGKTHWMVMTPYPGTNDDYENPSILCSNDGINWTVPVGLTNPIYNKPNTNVNDYNSDGAIHYDGAKLWLVFRSIQLGFAGQEERLYMTSSSNGVNWAAPQLVMVNNQALKSVVSPSIGQDAVTGKWYMWAVRYLNGVLGSNEVVRFEANSPLGPWTNETVCTGVATTQGYQPWHVDCHWDGLQWVLLTYATYGGSSSAGGFLRRSVSYDGISWTTDPEDMMRGDATATWDEYLYKSCIRPAIINGKPGYRVWYTGFHNNTWRIGYTTAELIPI